MTNSYIIECVYRDFDDIIRCYVRNKLYHKQYTDDLVQEVYLRMLTQKNDKLVMLYFTDGTLNYIRRVITNLLKNHKDVYHKSVRLITQDIPIIEEEDYTVSDEEGYTEYYEKLDDTIEYFDRQEFFIQLYKYYILNSDTLKVKDISRDLNIGKGTLFNKFTRIKKEFKQYHDDKRKIIH
jgi:hypothetical protein